LTGITLPKGLTYIDIGTFMDCTGLTEISLPNGIRTISAYTFSGCTSLAKVILPDGLEFIEEGAFMDCQSLTSIMIPGSVTVIVDSSFYGCYNLNKLYFFGDAPQYIGYISESEDITLYYIEGAKDWTSPTYQDYPTATFKGFFDIPLTEYYLDPVLWAAEQNITTGTSQGIFSPERDCTRGQIVTFLWRAAGSPDPTSTTNPFTDVSPEDYYYKAILWAVENSITNGTGNGKFSPDKTCTRGQVATFLWRAKGQPAPTNTESPFKDVDTNAYYYDAVLWAVENGITNGTGKDTFSPDKTCTRGQIVTFLYRAYA
jgi:hypothetical protein